MKGIEAKNDVDRIRRNQQNSYVYHFSPKLPQFIPTWSEMRIVTGKGTITKTGLLTPRTAGSSWTLGCGAEVVGSSTDRSFTSDARKIMYAYGSCTGAMNWFAGLLVEEKRHNEYSMATFTRARFAHRRCSVPIEYTIVPPLAKKLAYPMQRNVLTIGKLDSRGSGVNAGQDASVSYIRVRDERNRFPT